MGRSQLGAVVIAAVVALCGTTNEHSADAGLDADVDHDADVDRDTDTPDDADPDHDADATADACPIPRAAPC